MSEITEPEPKRPQFQESRCASRVLRDRPHVRLDRHLLALFREEVRNDPDLKLQDAFEDALWLWLRTRALVKMEVLRTYAKGASATLTTSLRETAARQREREGAV